MKTKLFLALSVASALFITSCNDDDNQGFENEVTAPATYSFERNGENTVSFGGQTTRIKMATELASAMTDFDNVTEAQLTNMFANTNNPFEEAALNTSGKSVESKVAASADYFASNQTARATIVNNFKSWMKNQVDVVKPNKNTVAENGTAGQLADGSKTRYVNANGFENNQVVAKTLIGALMVDQALNNYLSTTVLDAGENVANNNTGTVADGKTYTTMEHKWDEAYGYVYGLEENPAQPALGADSFLNKYIGKVNSDDDFNTIGADIFNAFKLGRAAIVAKNYTVRDQQADLIRLNISKVIGVRAVHYLQASKTAITAEQMGTAAHDLSEGIGFVNSLQFTHNPSTNQPYLSASEVAQFNSDVNNLYTTTTAELDSWSTKIANKFGFTVEQAAN